MDKDMIRTSLADELDRRSKSTWSRREPDPIDVAIATTKDRITASVSGRHRVAARLKHAVPA